MNTLTVAVDLVRRVLERNPQMYAHELQEVTNLGTPRHLFPNTDPADYGTIVDRPLVSWRTFGATYLPVAS